MTHTPSTSGDHPGAPPTRAVDRFIDAIRGATFGTAEGIYDPAVLLDATVPGWRFKVTGDHAVRSEYGRWFAAPAEFVEIHRHLTANGEVVEYYINWTEDDVTHGAHHAHVLTVDTATDRITEDHVFCGGRWPAPLLAEMNAPSFTTTA